MHGSSLGYAACLRPRLACLVAVDLWCKDRLGSRRHFFLTALIRYPDSGIGSRYVFRLWEGDFGSWYWIFVHRVLSYHTKPSKCAVLRACKPTNNRPQPYHLHTTTYTDPPKNQKKPTH